MVSEAPATTQLDNSDQTGLTSNQTGLTGGQSGLRRDDPVVDNLTEEERATVSYPTWIPLNLDFSGPMALNTPLD